MRLTKSTKNSEQSKVAEGATNSTNPFRVFTKGATKPEPNAQDQRITDTNATIDLLNSSKADLPGRVSFSKNDVYEIDYSDIENDTDTSRSVEQAENFRKKNVRFEDEFFKDPSQDDGIGEDMQIEPSFGAYAENDIATNHSQENRENEIPRRRDGGIDDLPRPEKYCCSLKCNSLLCKTDEHSAPASQTNNIDHSEKIIEDYKREIENINRRHELELKWSGNTSHDNPDPLPKYFNSKSMSTSNLDMFSENMSSEQKPKKANGTPYTKANNAENEKRPIAKQPWSITNHEIEKRPSISSGKTESEDSATRGSSSTVIDNYLKATNQKIPPKAAVETAKPKLSKKLAPPVVNPGRKIKSAQLSNFQPTLSRLSKAKSVSCLQGTDSKLKEFHIDKVESWMSTHEDTFSDTGLAQYKKTKMGSSGNLSYKKAWRETPTSKTDDEGNFSLDDQIDSNSYEDSTYGEMGNVAKQIDQLNTNGKYI